MTLLQFAMILFLYNGDDGGTVKIHEVQFNTMKACEVAAAKFTETKEAKAGTSFHRSGFAICIDRGQAPVK
ncbi:MAG: hypothetical protein JNM93_03640 [Bacteriovoracaceae bacterium]|nr:hypothetical protein [Bacteriovoracaceae bacterium]